MANWNARIASDFEYAAWENNIYKDKSSETESAEMSTTEKIIAELENDIQIFEEKLNVVKAFKLLLYQNNQDIKFLTKKNEELTIENQVLKANLRDVANQLRSGVSKIQQKTMARVIEECFGEKK